MFLQSLHQDLFIKMVPPPDHPIHDILRLTRGTLTTPTEVDSTMERLFGPQRVNEATIHARRSLGLSLTPLEELDKAVKGFFDDGPATASKKFAALQSAVLFGETSIELDNPPSFMEDFIIQKFPWNSCKLATTLVLLYASSPEPESMSEALKFQSRSLGGLPTMAEILNRPSADLRLRFSRAKVDAIDGKTGKVTVLGVVLADVEMIERGEQRSLDMRYTSFAHSFVLAVGREGFRVYQAWGQHGYRLDKYLMGGGSRLRSWKEARKFLKKFQKLSCSQV